MPMLKIDISYMRRCLELAKKSQYLVKSGALVGCVIVNNNQIVAEGRYQPPTQQHAEIVALNLAGAEAQGATLYVSLEPCSHWGKTGPCCDAVIAAGIKKVVFGLIDPNPLVAGNGINSLKSAGVEVVGPILAEECAELNQGFIKRMTQGLPFVRCKLAMSLDGHTAMASGESKWITGEAARADVQNLRAKCGAIVTGVDTVVVDDPQLNVRLSETVEQPLRVIVDSMLRTPTQARIFEGEGDVLIACSKTTQSDSISTFSSTSSVVETCRFIGEDQQVDLYALMQYLAKQKQCNEVLLESGPTLAGAMLRAGLVDEIITYIAPKLLGNEARPLFSLPGLNAMNDQIRLEFIAMEKIGNDCKIRSRVVTTEVNE